jgi:hypothetical protein
VLGQLLNRTVIVHDILNHYSEDLSSDEPHSMPFELVFDLPHLSAYQSVVTLSELRDNDWDMQLDAVAHFGTKYLPQVRSQPCGVWLCVVAHAHLPTTVREAPAHGGGGPACRAGATQGPMPDAAPAATRWPPIVQKRNAQPGRLTHTDVVRCGAMCMPAPFVHLLPSIQIKTAHALNISDEDAEYIDLKVSRRACWAGAVVTHMNARAQAS